MCMNKKGGYVRKGSFISDNGRKYLSYGYSNGVEVVSMKRFEEVTGVRFTLKHNDKMETLISLSTSPLCDLCNKRAAVPGSICAECYSRKMMDRFEDLKKKLLVNDRILKNSKLAVVPNLDKYKFVRFEAFGDIEAGVDGKCYQIYNYFLIAACNPNTQFALWTKNPWIIEQAFEDFNLVKPSNLQIIGSSWFINNPMIEYFKRFWFIDRIFTVYNDIQKAVINCGGLSCKGCDYKCYRGTHTNYEINEFLK